MDQKTSLLEQLRIDRTPEPQRTRGRGGRTALIVSIVIVVLAGIAALVVWMTSRADEIPVHTAVATAISSGGAGAGAGASILDASGYVVALRDASVSANAVYKVKEMLVNQGDSVKAGQVIALLDDTYVRAGLRQAEAQAAQARASLAQAQLAVDDARPTFQREQKELARGLISQDTFDTTKASYDAAVATVEVDKQTLAVDESAVVESQTLEHDTVIRAPFDGVVTAKNAQPGQIVSPQFSGGGGLAEIVDMNSLEVDVDVSENYISRVHPNQPATITLDAYPDWHIPAHVIAIIPTADKSKATVSVRVGFKEGDPRVLPQMGARVSFLADASTPAGAAAAPVRSGVIIPTAAVSANSNNSTGTVYVVTGDTVQSHTVQLGANTANGQEVLSGLDAGATVAIGDFSKLKNGVKIRVTQ